MDDFKIGDDFDENGNVKEHNKVDKKIAIIIVVVVAIIIGLLVFFVSNAILGGGGDDDTPVDTEMPLTDENVQILYKYVAYKDNGHGNDKLLKEKAVQSDSFTDEEKIYYSLQFIQPADLVYSEKMTDKKQKIYDLTLAKIRNYSQRFFGKEVVINPVDELIYKFTFSINDMSVAKLTYSEEEQVYKVVFEKEEEKEELVKPYYTELTSAVKKADSTLILTEKVIYTTSSKEDKDNTYKINIYKDYDHTTLIEMKQNITEDDLKANPIAIKNYIDKAATITYTFKVNTINRNYYFDSSSITY